MRFVGNLILNTSCGFYYDDVTVPSFITLNTATLPLKLSRNAQRAVIVFFCG